MRVTGDSARTPAGSVIAASTATTAYFAIALICALDTLASKEKRITGSEKSDKAVRLLDEMANEQTFSSAAWISLTPRTLEDVAAHYATFFRVVTGGVISLTPQDERDMVAFMKLLD